MKPRIGVTSELEESRLGEAGRVWRTYQASIEQAGGVAVFLNEKVRGQEAEVLADLQGLLLSGGNDVDLSMYPNPPELNGEAPATVMRRRRMKPEPVRDAYELALLEVALQRDLPVLGVCRGCQVLNVGLGGRLILDIPTEVDSPLRHGSVPETRESSIHAVQVTPGTLLAGILPPGEFRWCNSRHHQAVSVDEAFRVRVAAVSPEDGVIEAIEVPGRRWMVGVQWHPELPRDPDVREQSAPLFRAFVQASGW